MNVHNLIFILRCHQFFIFGCCVFFFSSLFSFFPSIHHTSAMMGHIPCARCGMGRLLQVRKWPSQCQTLKARKGKESEEQKVQAESKHASHV
jgi:hypothetical protein